MEIFGRLSKSKEFSNYHYQNQIVYLHEDTYDIDSLLRLNDIFNCFKTYSILIPISKFKFNEDYRMYIESEDFNDWMNKIKETLEKEDKPVFETKGLSIKEIEKLYLFHLSEIRKINLVYYGLDEEEKLEKNSFLIAVIEKIRKNSPFGVLRSMYILVDKENIDNLKNIMEKNKYNQF